MVEDSRESFGVKTQIGWGGGGEGETVCCGACKVNVA